MERGQDVELTGGKLIEVVFFDLGNTLINDGRLWVPGAKNCLEVLHAKGLRLGIISNTGDLTEAQIEGLFPADFPSDLFEANLVLYSSIIGIEKPDAGVFRAAIEAALVSPAACLFCTESLRDCLASQALGMIAFRLSRQTREDFEAMLSLIEDYPNFTSE